MILKKLKEEKLRRRVIVNYIMKYEFKSRDQKMWIKVWNMEMYRKKENIRKK